MFPCKRFRKDGFCLSEVSYAGSASTMLVGVLVGITLSNLKPAAARSLSNSLAVLSFPPVITNMSRSKNFEKSGWSFSGTTESTMITRPFSCIWLRQFLSTRIAPSSSQSWMIHFMMYASPPAGTLFEKVAGDRRAPICQACCFNAFARARDHRLGVKQNAKGPRVRIENRRNQSAMATADIDDLVEAREVVKRRDFLVYDGGHSAHRVVEDSRIVGVLLKILPDVHSKVVIEGDFTCLDAMREVAPCGVVFLAQFGNDKPAHRTRRVRNEEL